MSIWQQFTRLLITWAIALLLVSLTLWSPVGLSPIIWKHVPSTLSSNASFSPTPPYVPTSTRRLLVLVGLHSANLAMDGAVWENLAHFLAHGYIPADIRTRLFARVDFMFVITKAEQTALIVMNTSLPNVRVAITPPPPATFSSLRPAAVLLEGIGALVWPVVSAEQYNRIMVFNTSDTRGPLWPSPSVVFGRTFWVDVLSGYGLVSHLQRVAQSGKGVASAVAASRDIKRLVLVVRNSTRQRQRLFVSLPAAAASLYFNPRKLRTFADKPPSKFSEQLSAEGFHLFSLNAQRRAGSSDCPLCSAFSPFGDGAVAIEGINLISSQMNEAYMDELRNSLEYFDASSHAIDSVQKYKMPLVRLLLKPPRIPLQAYLQPSSSQAYTDAMFLLWRMAAGPRLVETLEEHWCSNLAEKWSEVASARFKPSREPVREHNF